MCILFVYRDPDAAVGSYRLIVASNRDETYKRPASAAHYWQGHPECLGGTDMEPGKEGGTWLALSMKGRAAVILNLVTAEVPSLPKKGRGSLISNFVTSDDTGESYLNKLHAENSNGQPYNPYCLVLLDLINADIRYLSSSETSPGPQICQGNIIGVGNSGIECPYKKVEMGKVEFRNIVQNVDTSKKDDLVESLINFLKSRKRCLPDPELQKRSLANYEELSSIFVSVGTYGTRTHSVLLVDASNQVTFVEETRMPDSTWKRQNFQDKLIHNMY